MKFFRPATIALACALTVSGCANVGRMQTEVRAAAAERTARPAIEQTAQVRTIQNYVPRAVEVEEVDSRNAVTISVNGANFYDMLRQLAGRLGFGLTATQTVDLQRTITLDLKGLSVQQAMRQIAWQAGYALVFNDNDRNVTVTNEATYVFRIPGDELKRVATSFSYGGSPISGNVGGASGGQGGASGGGGSGSSSGGGFNPIKGEFTVQGTYASNPQAFRAFIESMAGGNAKVDVFLESGMVSVRGNGQALKRVNDFLAKYAYDSRRQVEITARIVEVALSNEFRYGIQWDKVLNAAGTRSLSIDTLGTVGTGGVGSLSFTSASISSVIRALENYSAVDVTAVPKLIVANNTSGVIFEGRQLPYVPSVQQTTTGNGSSAQVTVTGNGAYAVDGVNLAVHANILDDSNAMLTIVPSSLSLGELRKFLNDQVQMYEQSVKNGGQRISIQSGQTVVIGGNRYTKNNGSTNGVPGLVNVPVIGKAFSGNTKDIDTRETVLIMHARVLRPGPMEIIFSEAI